MKYEVKRVLRSTAVIEVTGFRYTPFQLQAAIADAIEDDSDIVEWDDEDEDISVEEASASCNSPYGRS